MQSAWAAKKKDKDFSSSIWDLFSTLFLRGISLIFGKKYSIKVDDVMNKNLSSTHWFCFCVCFSFSSFFLHLSSRYFCHKYFANCVYIHSQPELRLSIKKGIQVNSRTKRFEEKDTFRAAHQRYPPMKAVFFFKFNTYSMTLLTKVFRSGRLDIGQFPFLAFYKSREVRGKSLLSWTKEEIPSGLDMP